MNYSFDTDVAKEYGVQEAIMIRNFQFWIAKNKADNRHFYDGRFWTYSSKRALLELFPFWSEQNIKTILTRLKEKGVIITGSYNKSPYDKTLWYAFAREEKWIGENQTIDKLELTNRLVQTNQAIPDSNTDNNTDREEKVVKETTTTDHFKDLWNNGLVEFYKERYPFNVKIPRIMKSEIKNLYQRDRELKSLIKELLADGLVNEDDVSDAWAWAFQMIWERIQKSGFLRGEKKAGDGYSKPFLFDVEYFLRPSNFIKLVSPTSKYCLDDPR